MYTEKTYGMEKTHLRLSNAAQAVYSNTDPLRIYEREILDEDGEVIDYRYAVTGCLGDREYLTEEELERFLLDSMPSYFFPDAEFVDDWFGGEIPVCMSTEEVERLIREWTQPDGEAIDYWSQLHDATPEEIEAFGTC